MAASETKRAEDLPLGRRVIAFLVLMIFEFFYGWTWNTVDALRPEIAAELELSLPQAGSMYTAQSLGAMVGAIGFGMLADRYGRRNMLGVIIIGYAVMGAAGALVASYAQVLAQRFLLGIFLGAIFPVLIASYMGLFAPDWRGKLASLGQGTYNASVALLGIAYAATSKSDWHIILWAGAVPPLVLLPLLYLFVPDDRKVMPWGATAAPLATTKFPIVELFGPRLRRVTLLLFLLTGLNFFGYQAFAGWATTYLKEVRGFDQAVAGSVYAWVFWGALVGGFFWGWFSDRFGRRVAGIGFLVGALAALLYLWLLRTPFELKVGGALWGFMITASVAWAPWMSVLYPAHLRSTAMSIFNWGRIISMTAPLITGFVGKAYGLEYAMLMSVVGFGLGAVVWLMLPETLPEEAK